MDQTNEDVRVGTQDNEDLSALDRGDVFGDDLDSVLNEPKAEEPKAEEPKAEEPKAEEPKAEEPKAEEPKVAPKQDHMIPKARLDEEVRKRRELENRLKALEEKGANPPKDEPPPDPVTVVGTPEWFDAKEEAYMDAILDGQPDAAKTLRREIRSAEQAKFEATVEERSVRAVKAVDVQAEFDSAVEKLEAAFPVFQPTHEEYDDISVQAIIAAQHALLKRDPTLAPGKALLDAAAKFGFSIDAPRTSAVVTESDEPVIPPGRPAQPPRGNTADTPAAPRGRLTDTMLEKMTADELARARGDFI